MTRKEAFMYLFMIELEHVLNSKSTEIARISFQSDEANTDRALKEYIRQVIKNECNSLSITSSINTLNINDVFGRNISVPITDEIRYAKITNVYLPEQITSRISNYLNRNKTGVITNPDLCFEISIGGEVVYERIELKSTKNNAIPGSSVQQVEPDEWVIFVRHYTSNASVVTGKYIYAINSTMQFPDRSPRPQVSFNELRDWNVAHRKITGDSVTFSPGNSDKEKLGVINDWQDVLAGRWVKVVYDLKRYTSEPWFNNVLRKFIIQFLSTYDGLTLDEQNEYKDLLKQLIK